MSVPEQAGPTERLARYVVEARYDRLPQEALEIARKAILDCTGLFLRGRHMAEGEVITVYVRDMGGAPEAAIIGGGFRTQTSLAALANGTMAAATDLSDTSLTWNIGHPTEVILPAILALGEKHRLSGRELLTAYIAGFEAGSRIGASLVRNYESGWHTPCIAGTMAATAAAARALSLDVSQTRMALGVAASLASGLKRNFGTMARAFHSGKAAQDGVSAALLVKAGLTASASVLEGPAGFVRLMGGEEAVLERAVGSLGATYDIVAPGGLCLKLHASAYMTHWCVDAVLYLVAGYGFKSEEVESITCAVPRILTLTLYPRPRTGAEGISSLHYSVAAALLDGRVGLAELTDAAVRRPEAQELMARVAVVHPPATESMALAEAFRQAQSVTVRLKNGSEFTHRVDFPRGDVRDPFSDEEVAAKFRESAGDALSPEAREQVIGLVRGLDSLDDIGALAGLLLGG